MICAGGGRQSPEALSEAELIPLLESVRDRAEARDMRFLWYTPTEYCALSPLELGLGAKSCNAAEYSICIEPNGDVLPCQSYYEPVGNLLCEDWAAIWDSDLFRRIRLRRENPRVAGLDERCYECADLEVCGGGCPLQREERRKEALVDVRHGE
jgi:radical SAM protein with 4Fe4S-binding SPASM domain